MGLTRPRAHQLQGSDYKQSVRAIQTSSVTLSGGAPATVDGVSLSANDRVLVTGQSTGSENGLYRVQTVGTGSDGTWVRAKDAKNDGDITAGMVVMVTEGTTYADTSWKVTTDDPITLGTTALTFEQSSAYAFGTVSADGTSLVADAVGDTLTVSAGTNISISGDAGTDTMTIAVADAPTFSGNLTAGNLITTGTVEVDRLSLSSSQTTVSPLLLTASSLQDGVGALRIEGAQADIFLNPATATHTTVTFAVNDDQRAAFGMDNNSDFYITRRTGGTWYDDTLVIDRDTGDVALGYTLTATGNITGGNLTTTGTITTGGLVTGNLTPTANVTYYLGNATNQWHSVFVGPGSLYINGQKVLQEDSGTIVVGADENQNISLTTTGTGDIEFNPGGSIELKGNVVLAAGKTMSQAGGAASEFSAGVKSDSVTSRTTNTNLTLSGNGTGVVNVNDSMTVANDLTVTGNLTINGATTTVSSTNTTIEDALIVLVDGQSGAPTKDAGLVIDRGSSTNVAWMWDESADQFVAITTSEDGTTAGDVTITDYTDIRVGSATIDDTLTATGNVTGGNLITSAQVVATGNVTGGNLITGAQVVATGNVTGGNVLSSGAIHTGNNGVVRFYDSDGSNYVEFRSQSTVASNLQFKWPAADGTSGQVLQTDGAGTLSFATASGGGGASGFQSSTITTHPASGGNEDLATGPNDDTVETPFESGAQDAFGVSLGTVYDQMEPIGSTTTVDLGDSEAYVGA